MSPNLSSQRHMSPATVLEAPKLHFYQPSIDAGIHDVNLEVFGGGPYETSLLPLYANHPARHVWDEEVK